ncbi:disease resistance protein Pikm1-TS-like [Phragmites australis]|uniref:disease resistance protein Pikm1-TS-like n=1 Tax=Phragmites australis TaxID=29695 RepID=UPI002D78143F|nr:disease resistance protein Pikm1-TS-like [Phragmites australis]
MAPAASEEQPKGGEPAAEEKEEVVAVVEPLRRRISSVLEAVGPLRVTSYRMRYSLEFIAMELALLTLSPQPASQEYHVIYRLVVWLNYLKEKAMDIESMLDQYEAHPLHHALPRSAAPWFCRRRDHDSTLHGGFLSSAANLYCATEHPCSYRYKMNDPVLSGSGLSLLPHDVAEEGGLHLVGIDGPAKKLLRWLRLTAADKRTTVISIVGPTGVGKTTFAMELHRRLQNRLLLKRILSDIVKPRELEVLSSERSHATTTLEAELELLARNIRERLQDKRYFILIEDIWEASDWEKIKGAFPKNKCGSQILITTRVRSVARSCCSESDHHEGLVHEMKPLNKRDSERLLLIEAFGSVDGSPKGKPFRNVCEEILRRCGGIPLFITGMAGWLKERQQKGYTFYSVEQVPQTLKQFEQGLAPTYYELPYQLRLMFLYMSMFPQGYRIAKEQLIWKWTIEGLNSEYGIHCDAYDLACRCFSELADRNVIIRVENCKCHPEIEACPWQVNCYMLQFLASISAEMGFAFTSTTLASAKAGAGATGDNKRAVPRRLALHHPDPELPRLLRTMDLSQTRSLAVSGEVDQIPLDKFIYLVVLDLEGWKNLKDEDLLMICTSKQYLLKYLSVKNTRVRKLPSEIKELCCLKTLDISHTQISELPSEVCELEDLLKMDLRNTQIRQLPEQIAGLRCLQDLRIGGDGIANSDETATKIPEGVRHVYRLVTLATVDLSECSSSFVHALGDLSQLMVLAITWSFHQCTEGSYSDALLSSLKKWRLLESLTIYCGLGCSMEFLSSLSKPPNTRLEKFKVTGGRFVSVPQWIKRLKHLAFLQITVCKMVPHDLKILGDLHSLRCLVLGLEFAPSEGIVVESEGFSELLKFSVDCPVPWLNFRTGAMRKLKYLELKVCSGPPSRGSAVPSGIGNLRSLMDVVLYYNQKWCSGSSHIKKTVEAVKKEVAEHCNPIDLIINGTRDDGVQKFDEETEIQSEVRR